MTKEKFIGFIVHRNYGDGPLFKGDTISLGDMIDTKDKTPISTGLTAEEALAQALLRLKDLKMNQGALAIIGIDMPDDAFTSFKGLVDGFHKHVMEKEGAEQEPPHTTH